MPTAIALAAALHRVQHHLHHTSGLYAVSMDRRRTPDGFSRELHRDLAGQLALAMHEEWRLQQWLPGDAANDAQHDTSAD
jgi:hypothetical protein